MGKFPFTHPHKWMTVGKKNSETFKSGVKRFGKRHVSYCIPANSFVLKCGPGIQKHYFVCAVRRVSPVSSWGIPCLPISILSHKMNTLSVLLLSPFLLSSEGNVHFALLLALQYLVAVYRSAPLVYLVEDI